MKRAIWQPKPALAPITLGALATLLWSSPVFGLNPSFDISQYAHTAWTIRDGFFKGSIYSIAQTPDGYLMLGTEFGIVRFDGIRKTAWEPRGQALPGENRVDAWGQISLDLQATARRFLPCP